MFPRDNDLYVDMLDPRLYTFSESIHVFGFVYFIVVSAVPEGGK